MSTLIPPRYELPILDPRTGQMSREWYKFLVQLAQAAGGSTSGVQDARLESEMNSPEDLALTALSATHRQTALLLEPVDLPKPKPQILEYWPWV